MPRKRYSTEQIVTKLRQAEVELGRGLRTPQVCKKLGVSEQTYYRWRKEYGGLRLDQAKRLKELERENTRLKKLVADQALDNMILKPRETSEPVPATPGRGACAAPAGRLGAKRWPRETSEPVPATPGRGACAAPAGRLGAAGLPSAQSGAVNTPASAGRSGRRTPVGRAPHRVGHAVWAVWVSTHHRALARGRLDSESQTHRATLAARRPQSAAETAETGAAVACGWLVHSPTSRVSAPRVGV